MAEKLLEKDVPKEGEGTDKKAGFVQEEKTEEKKPEMINVTVSEVPGRTVELQGEKGKFTVGDALEQARKKGLRIKRKDVMLGNERVDLDDQLEDEDAVLLVSRITGGFKVLL